MSSVRQEGSAADNLPILVGASLAALIAVLSFSLLEGLTAVLSCLLGGMMLTIAFSDARSFTVPDRLSLPAIPLGLLSAGIVAQGTDPDAAVLHHLVAAAAAGGLFYALALGFRMLKGHDGLGLGDVKLAAAGGAWVGFAGMTTVVLFACAGAIGFAIVQAMFGHRPVDRSTMIPFGAFLAPAIWLVWTLTQLGMGFAT